jgi:3-phenylpropionate/trans-cinnamate dioxygenase ferredoxin reductase component
MSSKRSTFVIIGGGLAGASAAATLREEGFDGRVVIVGSESEAPYHRPPLSKEYLRGEDDSESKLPVHEPAYYRDQEIELRLGTPVAALEAGAHEVVLDGGERIEFAAALLATGSEPRALSIPGADLDAVHYLRTHGDSDALAARLKGARHIVVIGAGWIGCEVAASARQLGVDVTIVAPNHVPLEKVLGMQLGGFYRDVHRDHGVELLLESEAVRIEGAGTVERVVTADGRTVECDAVVAAIGATPRIDLAREAGIFVDNGVLVDGRLQTGAPGVFAAGDIASVPNPNYGGRRLRVEHWANALDQGPAAARAMLGSDDLWRRVPYFFSDQYDVGMEFAGELGSADRVVLRGDMAGREFIAFWLSRDHLVAGMNVNVWDVSEPIQALISMNAVVDDKQLADPDVSLAELAANV